MPVLFVDVLEIEIKIGHRGLTGIAHDFHIFDDCRTGERQATQLSLTKTVKALQTKAHSCRSQLQIRDVIRWRRAAKWSGAHVFHEPRVATLLTSIPYTYFLPKTRSQFPCDGR